VTGANAPVILSDRPSRSSIAKDLNAAVTRPFASLRVTGSYSG